jgi:hypothetical protein
MAGYEDVNDAERLAHDPMFRLIGSEKIWERGAALTSGRCATKGRLPLTPPTKAVPATKT